MVTIIMYTELALWITGLPCGRCALVGMRQAAKLW